MLKKIIFLVTGLVSICLIHIPAVSSAGALLGTDSSDTNGGYIDFQSGFTLLKSMSVHYIPLLYPDALYVGSGHDLFSDQVPMIYTEKNTDTDKISIDLKWQLEGGWFMEIYSEIGHKDEDNGNAFHLQIKNPMDTDIGIIFIHKF